MLKTQHPITEFDEDRSAILMPDPYSIGAETLIPARGVLCFFQDVIKDLCDEGKLKEIGHLSSEIGKNPVYIYGNGTDGVTVVHPGVGAPLAAAFLEELIANGVTRFIACGGAGVLDRSKAPGYPFILTSAIRDEGTSYHYLPPSREVKPHADAVRALEDACCEMGIEYQLGKSWTTDAIYRETKGKRKDRLEEGCLVVEMEAAAFFAVAQFREIKFGQIVYGGDLVHPDGWDGRRWHKRNADRRLMFELAVNAAMKL